MTSACTVHGAERRGCHGYLRGVPQVELRVEARCPPAGHRPLHLPHRDTQVLTNVVKLLAYPK